MITYYFRTIKDSAIKTIDDVRNGVWIHAVDPNEAELTTLFTKLGLDETLVEDALDFYEVPRMERSTGGTYFFTRYPLADEKEDVDTAPLMIVIGESFVMTVALRKVPHFDQFISGKEIVHTTQKTKLFLQLMQATTESYEKQLVKLRRSVHKDRAKLRTIGNKEIERFVNYEHKLNDMISALTPTNTALQQITKGNVMQMYNEDMELMEDLLIDNNQLVDSARAVLRTIQNVRNATEAILANDLNATIKTLTILTIILTIPTIIASLYGMNVALPFADTPHAFWGVLGTVIIVVALVFAVFKRNRWL